MLHNGKILDFKDNNKSADKSLKDLCLQENIRKKHVDLIFKTLKLCKTTTGLM